MMKKKRKYIYLSNLNFDGTVYQTQILDWLHLFRKRELEFDLIQVFHLKDIKKPIYIKKQITDINKSTDLVTRFLFLFPSSGVFYILNGILIFFKILKYVFVYEEVLIFSRAIIGKEIDLLRKISPANIIYYFDARAAAAEENKILAIKNLDFSLRKYIVIANIYYLVYRTLCAADKVFIVSHVLEKYFEDAYSLINKKFVSYPCLAESNKFYYCTELRREIRNTLHINDKVKVFIYSGGIADWHLSNKMFSFFLQLLIYEKNSLLLCLTKDNAGLERIKKELPEIESHFLSFSVQNEDVNKYLNAADYGLLFRENTIMNNVASPTKFAEYILCGLPVLISEGIGDYSNLVMEHDLGVLIKESILYKPCEFDFENFLVKEFDRKYISDFGKKRLSKSSILDNIIKELKS